jgi:hypothetical protein
MTDLSQLRLGDYRPVPRLSAPGHRVEGARTPAVDAHTHLGRWLTGGTWAAPSVAGLLGLMDSCNVAAAVNLDGRWGAELEANLVEVRHTLRQLVNVKGGVRHICR